MSTVPSALALTSIATDAEIISSDHRNNYTAIQSAVNALISLLSAGTSGQALVSGGGTTVNWGTAATTYRKTTAKAVNTTTTATDLLNGEITVAAGALGTTGVLRVTAFGDILQNSGAGAAVPRWQLVLGGTTVLDTGVGGGAALANAASRGSWKLVAHITNAGAANSQIADMLVQIGDSNGFSALGSAAFTTGTGMYSTVMNTGAVATAAHAIGSNSGLAVDTTASKTLVLNVINGSSSASYETRLLGALVEVI